ncbi:MAG: protein of unknown function DUF971 [Gammaproteobacteria bacterium]|nr:protein of unknown function DUF971 [Gammaproteobacteria bacterium]
MSADKPQPVAINLHQKSRVLSVSFDNGRTFELSCEYLRVHSPSAEVMGHGPGQEVLQTGKENVNIKDIEPVGHYAVKLLFDDGHSTGLYTWDYLYELGINHEQYWRNYLEALRKAGIRRELQ